MPDTLKWHPTAYAIVMAYSICARQRLPEADRPHAEAILGLVGDAASALEAGFEAAAAISPAAIDAWDDAAETTVVDVPAASLTWLGEQCLRGACAPSCLAAKFRAIASMASAMDG